MGKTIFDIISDIQHARTAIDALAFAPIHRAALTMAQQRLEQAADWLVMVVDETKQAGQPKLKA